MSHSVIFRCRYHVAMMVSMFLGTALLGSCTRQPMMGVGSEDEGDASRASSRYYCSDYPLSEPYKCDSKEEAVALRVCADWRITDNLEQESLKNCQQTLSIAVKAKEAKAQKIGTLEQETRAKEESLSALHRQLATCESHLTGERDAKQVLQLENGRHLTDNSVNNKKIEALTASLAAAYNVGNETVERLHTAYTVGNETNQKCVKRLKQKESEIHDLTVDFSRCRNVEKECKENEAIFLHACGANVLLNNTSSPFALPTVGNGEIRMGVLPPTLGAMCLLGLGGINYYRAQKVQKEMEEMKKVQKEMKKSVQEKDTKMQELERSMEYKDRQIVRKDKMIKKLVLLGEIGTIEGGWEVSEQCEYPSSALS